MRINLTENEAWTIANALRTAAEEYRKHSLSMADARTADQFLAQHREALALAERLEQGEEELEALGVD